MIGSFHNSENPHDNKTSDFLSDLQSVMQLVIYQDYFKALKTDIHINYIYNLSLHLTENELCQHYSSVNPFHGLSCCLF